MLEKQSSLDPGKSAILPEIATSQSDLDYFRGPEGLEGTPVPRSPAECG